MRRPLDAGLTTAKPRFFIDRYDMTAGNSDNLRLCLNMHDELYMIDLTQTLYFMADDHYTHVYYFNGTRFMVPFGLSRIEERFAMLAINTPHSFRRIGRKYIINLSTIHNISTTKQQLTLLPPNSKPVILQVSKPVLRELLADMTHEHVL